MAPGARKIKQEQHDIFGGVSAPGWERWHPSAVLPQIQDRVHGKRALVAPPLLLLTTFMW